MLRKLLLTVTVFLVTGPTAQAIASTLKFMHHKKHLTLTEKVEYFKRSVGHEQRVLVWLKGVKHNLSINHREQQRVDFQRRVSTAIRFHSHALRWHSDLLEHYSAKLLPPHYYAWLCIHSYEGSWTDDGAPYYGGLQMDIGFQSHYGSALLKSKGTANNWTPIEQMWVAEKAYSSGRGFGPWPNTAGYCNLN